MEPIRRTQPSELYQTFLLPRTESSLMAPQDHQIWKINRDCGFKTTK